MQNRLPTDECIGNVNYDGMSKELEEDSSNENLALQLFDGEEMNADMANFIGIHMLNEIIEPLEDRDFNQKQGAPNYFDKKTGAHFEFNVMHKKIQLL